MAGLAVTFFVLSGIAWWWLLVFFLLFDVSAIGYAVSNKAGAIGYNAVHNYVAPALVAAIYGILLAAGVVIWPLAFVAGCWFFHVGVDRAVGYGPRPTAVRHLHRDATIDSDSACGSAAPLS